jgi:hypothetical protein
MTDKVLDDLVWLLEWYVHENSSDPEIGFPVSGDSIRTNRRRIAEAMERVMIDG